MVTETNLLCYLRFYYAIYAIYRMCYIIYRIYIEYICIGYRIGYLFARDLKLRRSNVNSVFVYYRGSKLLMVSTIEVAIIAYRFADKCIGRSRLVTKSRG